MSAQTASLLAAITGLAGGAILAFSLNSVLFEVRFALTLLSQSVDSIAGKGDVVVYQGIAERLQKANRVSGSWVRAGIYCLVASCVLAAWSLYSA